MTIELTPEVEAGLRARASEIGVSPEALAEEAVKNYVRKTPPRVRTVPYKDRTAEMRWAAHPDPRYNGQWVVLEGDQVVASGADPKKIYREVREQGNLSPFMTYVSPERQEPFAGGWLD